MVKNYKHALGFDNSKESITIFKGDTYSYLDWFRASIARYSEKFGWYIIGEDAIPEDLPIGIEPVELKWSDISEGDNLKPDNEIKRVIGNLTHDATNSEYIGEVGKRYDLVLTVTREIPLDGVNLYVFKDVNGNECVWVTAAAILTEGTTYKLRGTVKELRTYNNSKQTILTRCKVQEEL